MNKPFVLVALSALLLTSACGDGGTEPEEPCTGSLCGDAERCADGPCRPANGGDIGQSGTDVDDAETNELGDAEDDAETPDSDAANTSDADADDTDADDTDADDTDADDTDADDTDAADTAEAPDADVVDDAVDGGDDTESSDAADGDAVEAVCGNTLLEGDEECDDGNTDDGDGCSALCLVEPLARDSIDWLSQDYVPGRPSADPYCAPAERQEARISTPLGYLRTDAAGDEGGISAQAPAYNPERQRWESRVLTTFDFRPYAESQPGLDGIPNGADVFEAEGQYVSIVGTNDSGGVAGWASSWGDGCQFFDGWISYDRFNVPDFDPDDRGSWASVSSPIEGVRNPTRDGCPDAFGSTTTRWTFASDFEFASDSTCPGDTGRKVMDTIVSDHDGGNHHEVFYFTDEYGSKSRWERWECGIPYPDHDFITDRCRYNEAQSAMHMAYGVDDDRRAIVNPSGATCYMTDCRDFTVVRPIESPGYKAAAWHHGAVVYFSGNVLTNGDFHRDAEGWHSEATTAEVATDSDGNHFLRVSAAGTGWHSVLGSSIDEFNRLFDGDGEEAHLPKYLHWGARIRHEGGGGTARLTVVEWGNPGGEIIDERGVSPTSAWQWVEFHRLLGPATNLLDVRFRLDGMDQLEVDDVYVYISNESER